MDADETGTYRWRYVENLYRNPAGLWRTLKFFSLIFAGVIVLGEIIVGFGEPIQEVKEVLSAYGIWVVFLALCYYVYAVIRGGHNTWDFAMDGNGVAACVVESGSKRVKAVNGLLHVLCGFCFIMSFVRRLSPPKDAYFPFASVRKIHPDRRNNAINVYIGHSRYLIFATNEHFGFVLNHITTHCREYLVK